MIRSRKAHESGVALVAALGVIVVVGIIAAFVCKVAVVSNQVTSSQGRSLVSYNLAISALNAGNQSLSSRQAESSQIDLTLLFPNGYENDPNAFADYPDCSSNEKHCYWWLYDGDKPQNFNGWKKGQGWDVHVFNVANTVKPKISVTGGDNNVLFDKTEERAIYRVEWMALDCRDDGQPGWQWYRVTSRGLDASGSRTYLQEYVKVPVSCKKDIEVDEAGSSDGTRNKRF